MHTNIFLFSSKIFTATSYYFFEWKIQGNLSYRRIFAIPLNLAVIPRPFDEVCTQVFGTSLGNLFRNSLLSL